VTPGDIWGPVQRSWWTIYDTHGTVVSTGERGPPGQRGEPLEFDDDDDDIDDEGPDEPHIIG
jgi:hypothetical protein